MVDRRCWVQPLDWPSQEGVSQLCLRCEKAFYINMQVKLVRFYFVGIKWLDPSSKSKSKKWDLQSWQVGVHIQIILGMCL